MINETLKMKLDEEKAILKGHQEKLNMLRRSL